MLNSRLLVVDPNEALLGVIATYLGGLGYQVDIASSDARALALVENGPYGLLILDLVHVHDSGLGLLRIFVKNNPRSPVILLTSRGYDSELLQMALRQGATTSLSKTMPIIDLSRQIALCQAAATTAAAG